jgi:hypothetical protein
MAGIWDRVIPGEDRVSSHLLKSGMHLAVYGVFSDQQVLNAVNRSVTEPLDNQAALDLAAIKTTISAMSGVNRLVAIERFDAMNIAAEMGVLTDESIYRQQLGIS